MLGDEQRLKSPLPITRDIQRQFAKVPFDRLAAFAIARIAALIGDRIMASMAEMVGQFGLHRPFIDSLGQLLQQPRFTNQVFRLFIVHQKLIQQFVANDGHFSSSCKKSIVCKMMTVYTNFCIGPTTTMVSLMETTIPDSGPMRFTRTPMASTTP